MMMVMRSYGECVRPLLCVYSPASNVRRTGQLNEIKTAPLKTIIKDVLLGFVYDLVFPGQHYLERASTSS